MGKEFTKHDHFFSKIMSDPKVARAFCQAYLPDEIKLQIDFSALIFDRCDTKIVEEGLKRHEIADVLFRVTLSGKLAYILIHIEHQSTADKLMPIRVLSYSSGLLLEYASLHPNEPLPLIVSLVYYHGQQRPYPYTLHVPDLFENLNEEQKSYLFKPILIDLSLYDDQMLRKHGDMAPVDILFKHIFDEHTKNNLELILSELAKANHNIRYYSVQYMMKRVDLPEDDFIELALKYLDEEDVMTVEEQIEQRGANREKYTIARNMLKDGLPIETISKYTGLSIALIKKLKTNQI